MADPKPDPLVTALETADQPAALSGGLDALLGRRVDHRDLVPSARERRLGAEAQDGFVYERPDERAERVPVRERFLAYLRDADPRGVGGYRRALWILPIAGMFGQLDQRILETLGPEIRADFGYSIQFLALILTLFRFMQTIIGPLMGYLADRVSRIWMFRIGSLISSGSSILFAVSTGIPSMITARLGGGLGDSVALPAGFPLLSDYFPPRGRARVFAFFAFVTTAGGVVLPPFVGFVAGRAGWRTGMLAFGVLGLLGALMLFLLKEPVRGYYERVEMGASEEVAQREERPMSWGEAWRAAASIVTVRRLWYSTPFNALSGYLSGIFLFLLLAESFQMSPAQRGFFGTVTAIVTMIALPFAGGVADRLLADRPARVMVLYGGLGVIGGILLIPIALFRSLPVVFLCILPMTFLGALIQPAQGALFSLLIPPRLRGLGMQTFVPWLLPALIAAPILSGYADAWGVQRAFLIIPPLSIIGSLFVLSAATGIERDLRAARAAAMADEEARRARESGRNKMLICRDVDVTYAGTQVLFGVDFDVEEGEVVALLGTNGAGKSTLLRAIAGIQEASNGAIYLDGQDVTHVPPHENARNGIVMVPGGHAIFPTLTVEENLRTAAWMYREEEEYVRTKTEEVLDMFPILRERLNEQAGNMSGGEQQMLALGQAFLMRPRLLMIDELSLGLAPQVVERLLDTVRRIHADGTTIILVEQSLNVALTIAERAVFMEKGEIRFDGSTAELISRPELVRSVFMGGAVSGRSLGTTRRASGSERENLLQVRDVSVSFGGVRALTGVSLDLSAGEIVGIIGPNGAGKTTLFDVISGFVQPDGGSISIGARDVTPLGPDARARLRLGRSFQNATLFGSMTVRENIAVAMERRAVVRNPVLAAVWAPQVRQSERKLYQRVDALIEILGLEAYANKFVGEISTGTRRTVDIACIMASQPRVLLLDEPSSGLAQAETEEMGPVLTRLVRETGAGLLVIEHDIPLITSVSDRLVAMELGRVLVAGDPAEVVNHPQVMASYLSASEGVLHRSGGGKLASMLRAAGVNGNREIDEEGEVEA
ncbi:MAG TPA: MFS transporter [Actinomycetota bacterium]|nr:MFS transporter [Actinomycetota bacterium]